VEVHGLDVVLVVVVVVERGVGHVVARVVVVRVGVVMFRVVQVLLVLVGVVGLVVALLVVFSLMGMLVGSLVKDLIVTELLVSLVVLMAVDIGIHCVVDGTVRVLIGGLVQDTLVLRLQGAVDGSLVEVHWLDVALVVVVVVEAVGSLVLDDVAARVIDVSLRVPVQIVVLSDEMAWLIVVFVLELTLAIVVGGVVMADVVVRGLIGGLVQDALVLRLHRAVDSGLVEVHGLDVVLVVVVVVEL